MAFGQSAFPPPTNWKSSLLNSHPLVGQILDVARSGKHVGVATDYQPLIEKLALTDLVLLGEIHDNPDHHLLQGWAIFQTALLRHQITDGLPEGAVALEQLRADQQSALDQFASETDNSEGKIPPSVERFKNAVNWDSGGWPKAIYDPLLAEVFRARLPIYAADVTRDSIKKVAKEGAAALPADERARLKLDVPLGPKLDDDTLSEIEAAHCGMMPKDAFGGMAFAQRYRDASLADALLKAADKHGAAILIAGNGHVRTDRGVPWYIRQRAPDKKVVSVMLIEVEDGKNDPEAYVPRDPDGKPAADYIVFTPRAERADPCEGMREKTGK